MKNIKSLKKLSHSYESDPGVSEPVILLFGNQLTLKFKLNEFVFPELKGKTGKIIFKNCCAFRVGTPNDEGYDLEPNQMWNRNDYPDIEWNNLYEVETPDAVDTKRFFVIEDNDITSKRHFVFFMKEATFECYADDYLERISNE